MAEDALSILIQTHLDATQQSVQADLTKIQNIVANNIKPLVIPIRFDNTKLKELQSQLQKLFDISKGVNFSGFSGPEVSTQRISAVTSEKLKQTLATQRQLDAEKLLQAQIDTNTKRQIADGRLRIQAQREEYAQSAKLRQQQALTNRIGESTGVFSTGIDRASITNALSGIRELQGATLQWNSAVNIQGQSYQRLNAIVKEGNGVQQTYALAINRSTGEITMADRGLRTFGDTLQNSLRKFGVWISASTIFMQTFRLLRQGIQDVVDLDKAMTNLQVVTGENNETARQSILIYNQIARELGVTTKAVMESADGWLRQGRSIEETNQLIRDGAVLQRIAMLQPAEATELLTASLNGFKLSAQDSMDIIDAMVSVDLKAATSVAELARALQNSASAANAVGISYQEMIGLIATASETTRISASVIGNALNSMIARMGNVRAGKFVDDETGEQLNDVEKVLNKLGIRLRENEFEWRNFGEVIAEIGSKWNTFNDIQQSAVITSLGMTRNANILRSILENYNSTIEYTNIATNSAGSAMERFGVISESIDFKINNLRESLVGFWENLIDTDFIKSFVDGLSTIVNTLTKLAPVLNFISQTVGTVLISRAVVAFVQFILGALPGISARISGIGTAFVEVDRGTRGVINSVNRLTTEVQELAQQYNNASAAANGLNTTSNASAASATVAVNGTQRRALQQTGVRMGSTIGIGVATSLTNAVMAFSSSSVAKDSGEAFGNGFTNALSATLSGWFVAGPLGALISGGVSIAGSIIGYIAGDAERTANKLEELNRVYQDQNNQIRNNISTINGLSDEYNRLSKGVTDYGTVVALSADDEQRYYDIVNQIAEISPELVMGYDNEGNAIIRKNDAIKESLALLEEEGRLNLEARVSEEALYTTLIAAQKEYDKQLKKIEDLNNISLDMIRTGFISEIGGPEGIGTLGAGMEFNGGSIDLTTPDALFDTAKLNRFREYVISLGVSVENLDSIYARYGVVLQDWSKNQESANKALEEAGKLMIPTLQLLPQLENGYEDLTNAQQSFITEFINGFSTAGSTSTEEVDATIEDFQTKISDFTNFMIGNRDLKIAIDNLFSPPENIDTIGEWQIYTEQWFAQVESLLSGFLTDKQIQDLKISLGIILVDQDGNEIGIKSDVLTNQVADVINSMGVTKIDAKALVGLSESDLNLLVGLDDSQLKQFRGTTGEDLLKFLDDYRKSLEVSTKDTTLSQERLEELNKATKELISSAKSLSSAFKEQNENGRLTADTILSLTDAGYASILEFDKETNAYRLNLEAAQYFYESKIKLQIAELESHRITNAAQLALYQDQARIASLYGSEIEKEATRANVNSASAMRDIIDGEISALSDVLKNMGDVVAGIYGDAADKLNFSEIFEERLGDSQYLYDKGEKDALSFWEGFKRVNDQMLAEFGDQFLADWRDNDLKYQQGILSFNDDQYEKEKQLLDRAIKNGVDAWTKYYDDLAKLNQKYYGSGSQFGNLESVQEKYNENLYNISSEKTRQLFEEETTLLEQSLKRGEINIVDYAKRYGDIWKKYYKDKEGYRDEDFQAEMEYLQNIKDATQNQIDAINSVMDENQSIIEFEVERIEFENEDIASLYDTQIEAIQDQIDAINGAADAEDRRLKILEAQNALQEAMSGRQRTRLVYTADGNMEYRADVSRDEEIRKAQKSLDDALREEEVAALEDIIANLEAERDIKLEANTEKIDTLNTRLEEINKPLTDLVTVLSENLEENFAFDPQFITDILGTTDSAQAIRDLMYEQDIAIDEDSFNQFFESLVSTASGLAENIYNKENTSPQAEKRRQEEAKQAVEGTLEKIDVNKLFNGEGVNNLFDYVKKMSEGLFSSGYANSLSTSFGMGNNVINNAQQQSINYTFNGGIQITEPVSDAQGFAVSLQKYLPNAAVQYEAKTIK